jgi:hypothetical protein
VFLLAPIHVFDTVRNPVLKADRFAIVMQP